MALSSAILPTGTGLNSFCPGPRLQPHLPGLSCSCLMGLLHLLPINPAAKCCPASFLGAGKGVAGMFLWPRWRRQACISQKCLVKNVPHTQGSQSRFPCERSCSTLPWPSLAHSCYPEQWGPTVPSSYWNSVRGCQWHSRML